ncbi:Uu.00g118400.m01.CDS01 [Anthostomella pinea]|uniref:Uu.00g118400.m01.CDS01 n=1 Tax=Anthostomella pinea TaxID=933095 RepID=A0AAI8VGX8_9PEZI|nr:Uu.00g118400.m01.CDS01 [Anthostomella pinea]
MEGYGLSRRGAANVQAVWPRISKAAEERERQAGNPCIDLSTSENWLLRNELIDLYKQAIEGSLSSHDLSYPDGFAGDLKLLDSLARFFNRYFQPLVPVSREHLAVAPGAAFALDSLLYNICEVGDGLLVPTPCWGSFEWLLSVRSGVQPVFVTTRNLDDVFSMGVIEALESAFSKSALPIKGVLFTNPHNPSGQCYPASIVKAIVKFCGQRGLHFISDEIYALSSFENPDVSHPVPFVSALQLDVESLGCDLSRIHTIWSISKDFGSSGLRMGCCVSQSNKPLVTGLALVSNTQTSSLTAIAAASLLSSPKLDDLLALNSHRLARAYLRLTSALKKRGLPYIPATMGPFILVRIAPHARTWEDEADAIQAYKSAGLSLSAGRSYHLPESEKGWARINFAIDPNQLTEALQRIGAAADDCTRL